MDVTIRVQAIRQFATQQMALLIDNAPVIINRSKRHSGCEVLYAAGWIVGEFCDQLVSPDQTLQALLRGLLPSLPSHIQSVFIQAIVKIFSMSAQSPDTDSVIISKLESLVTSSDLEVQERASTSLQLLKYIQKQRDRPEGGDNCAEEIKAFFVGELNPVGPKAQKKVPVPEGLDLDAWINEPEEESEEEEEEEHVGGNVFVKEDPEAVRRKVVEPTEEELEATRQARMQYQSANPNYLKDTPKASPSRSASAAAVADIPIQEIDLDVPLHIPGLANTDSYFNLSNTNGEERKKSKKKKKKSKKNTAPSSEEEEEGGPNVFVSQSLDMPEGATMSDNGSDDDDKDDPHRALSNIVLDDILEEERAKTEKKLKKKKKTSEDLIGDTESKSPDLVEHKVHKQKKKKKSKKTTAEDDLLGLSLEPNGTSPTTIEIVAQNDNIRVEVNKREATVENSAVSCNLTITNIGSDKLREISVTFTNSSAAASPTHLTKSLKPGNDYQLA